MSPQKLPTGELVFKMVYFGPELAGKNTSIKWIHHHEKDIQTGNLTQVRAGKDASFFDRMMAKVGNVQFQVWSVVGKKSFAALQKAILGGCDGIIFVWDMGKDAWKNNLSAVNILIDILKKKLINMPLICMLNKVDLPSDKIVTKKDVKNIFEKAHLKHVEFVDTIAIDGKNVKAAFTKCAKDILTNYIGKK
ncbi:MAG: ADP-ribosylation factor-like protein [Candidatus Helarchaeota archaeon]